MRPNILCFEAILHFELKWIVATILGVASTGIKVDIKATSSCVDFSIVRDHGNELLARAHVNYLSSLVEPPQVVSNFV